MLGPGFTTAMSCPGPRGDADAALGSLGGQRVAWVVAADRLTLFAGPTTLRYQVRDGIFPTRDVVPVLVEDGPVPQYRLAVSGVGTTGRGLVLEFRSGPGRAWGTQWTGGPDGVEPPLYTLVVGAVEGRQLVAGFVPISTVRVTHRETAAAAPTDLELYDVGDGEYLIAAGFVDGHSRDSSIRAYDKTGTVVAGWR